MITEAYHSRCSSWKVSSKASIASDLYASSKVKNDNDAIRNRIPDYDKWCINFSTKNQLAMNNRRLPIAAEFHFEHPVEKDSQKHHKLTQNSVSFSCPGKQDSRCCINFPHELTCQILTNQGIKNGRRAWPTRDHGEQSQKQLSYLPVIAVRIFGSEVSFKSKF